MAYTAKILIRDVVTAGKNDSVSQAARLMKKANVGCVIVTEGKKPVGIFTERDLLNRVVAEGLDPAKIPLAKIMTPSPVTIDAAKPLDQVFNLLAEGRFRHVPITDDGELVGIVSLSDLAKVLKPVFQEDKYTQYFVDFLDK